MDGLVLWLLAIGLVALWFLWWRRGRGTRGPRRKALSEWDAQRMVNDYLRLLERSGAGRTTLGDERTLPYPKPQLRAALEIALQRPYLGEEAKRRYTDAYLALAAFQPGAPAGLALDGSAAHPALERYRAQRAEAERRLHELGAMP